VANDPVNGTDPTGMYECDGSKTQCRVADRFVAGVKEAAGAKGASDSLKSLAATLGNKGQEGVTIGFGALATGTLGQASGQDVTLDVAQINGAAKDIASQSGVSFGSAIYAVGSSVLAHETKHVEDDGRYGASPRDRVTMEKRAYPMGDRVLDHFGVKGLGYVPGLSGYDYSKSIERRAKGSCVAGMVSQGISKERAVTSCNNQ
ncbi:hypothetical protein, partial [Sphingobium indicum]|uniref:hypothetical protein n=1 Tax=Sphingobium indicum TaxID=332055 RepID=UPI0018C99858